MIRQCPICSTRGGAVAFRELDADLLRCAECTHVYSTWEAPANFDNYWDGKIDGASESMRFYWSTARDPSYAEVLDRLEAPPGTAPGTQNSSGRGRILDVGCGVGYFVRFAKDRGWEAWGYEISKDAVEWGRRELSLENLEIGRVEDSDFEAGSFDVVTLWDVIEHIPDPLPLLRYCRSLLRPGGALFLQTPNADFQLFRARTIRALRRIPPNVSLLEARDHLNDFTFSSMGRALGSAGFSSHDFFVGLPTFTLGGGRSRLGIGLKLGYHYLARSVFALSRRRINLSNTIHVVAHVDEHETSPTPQPAPPTTRASVTLIRSPASTGGADP